jgi:hypothetical protein
MRTTQTQTIDQDVRRAMAGLTSEWQSRCCAFCGEMVVVESERSREASLAEMLGEATCPACGESNMFVVAGVVRSVHAAASGIAQASAL